MLDRFSLFSEIIIDKRKSNPLSWIVKIYEFNSNVIKDYDVLKYREEFIKKLKKKHPDKESFAKAIRREMMYHYWSRTEYELIMKVTENGRLILSPWIGHRNSEEAEIDVTDNNDFDWNGFAEKIYNRFLKILVIFLTKEQILFIRIPLPIIHSMSFAFFQTEPVCSGEIRKEW